jgi:hypothetical protein
VADLTTLQNVKDWLATGQQAFPPTDDRLLSRLISAASFFLESWISAPIGLANWQEIRDGVGGERADKMALQVTPVVGILSLNIDGIDVPAAPPLTQQGWTAGYTFSPTAVALRGYRFGRGTQNVIVQYTAGFAAIPFDIEQACIELVVRKYRERTRIGERTRSLGGAETVSYDTVAFKTMDMASDIQVLLQQYRRYTSMGTATLIPPVAPQVLIEDGSDPAVEILTEDDVTPIVVEGP